MRGLATTALAVALAAVIAVPAAAAPDPKPAPAKPPPAPAKPAKPVERRLHSDTVEASSFLWNDWNKFVENYHPNYVADDDPVTAWVEGAQGSGAGEWLRISVTPLEKTTRVRLRVRNGYQKSKDLWRANARAKAVTVRLLPSKAEKQVTLTDTDGWQEVAIDQPSGTLRAVELAIGSVYEGTKYADLCISDVQVLATSETPDNPAFEKSKLANLMSWRSARIAAAKLFTQKKVDLPLYPAYVTETTQGKRNGSTMDRAALIAAAAADPGFKEWKDPLATAATLEQSPYRMTPAQLAPASQAALVEVDGLEIPALYAITQHGLGARTLRLPVLGQVAAMFADQLRVLDVKDKRTIDQFRSNGRTCAARTLAWVLREQSREQAGPARVSAIAIGQCELLESREGSYVASTVELMVYDAAGRLALVIGDGHLDAYRWTTDGGRLMLEGGRALLEDGDVIDARRRAPVAKK